jgi:Rrf2 family iron-sulfur cluster assembly transcriptional regulator
MRLAIVPSGKLCQLEEIAVREKIPQHFLGKILQRLVHKRLIRSVKGVGGGFALALAPEKITLYLIADAIDDLSISIGDCIYGNKICGEEQPCPLHESWAKVRDQQLHFLQSIRIADLVKDGL